MSGEGPESIPTSADPRSKRPTKRRALSPTSSQSKHIDALFAKPDQEIRLPASGPVQKRTNAIPEIVTNVQGSSAGAGSGEFHVYKAARRREYERLRQMDEEVKQEKDKAEFEQEKEGRLKRDEERTSKNRKKRDKAKARKAGGGGNKVGAGGGPGAQNGENGNAVKSKGPRVDAKNRDHGRDDVAAEADASNETPHGATEEVKGIVIEED